MNVLGLISTPSIYIEIGQTSMKVVDGDDGLELSLDRLENGRLAPLCAERLTSTLRVFLKKHLWRSGLRAVCAINARGVSLRRLSIPGNPSDEELERLLPLQIEREFPLPPEELAWGYCRASKPQAGSSTEVLVAAVKKDVIEHYDEILSGSGISAVFTLAASARRALCPAVGAFSILDIGRYYSELSSFRNDLPEAVRVLGWGGENVTRAIENKLGVTRAEAEKAKISGVAPDSSKGQPPERLDKVIEEEIAAFARQLPSDAIGQRLYLTGGGARLLEMGRRLTTSLGNGLQCEQVEIPSGEGRSAAIIGLGRIAHRGLGAPELIFRQGLSREKKSARQPSALGWAALAIVLLVGCFSMRYVEAFVNKPRIIRQLAQVKTYRESLPRIERELALFDFLQTNQPTYLEPIYALANAAPSGTRIESISMNKRGDLALRASMKDPQQVTQLRSKLIESGLFSTVVVEEQTPSSDRQKVSVRLSGQWKPTGKAVEPPASSPANRTRRPGLDTPTNAVPVPSATPKSVPPREPPISS